MSTSKVNSASTVAEKANLIGSVKSDKEYVYELIEKIALIRLDLKKHFENSLTTTFSEEVDMNVIEIDNRLYELFGGLLGLYGNMIELELNH